MDIDLFQNPFAYPAEWASKTSGLIGARTLQVAGYDVTVPITAEHLDRVYLPLLAILANHAVGDRRVVAGLAGIPGSGKSTLAAALAVVGAQIWPADRLIVVGLDGWHYPNSVLDRKTTTDESGRVIPLRKRKGGPQSFDVSALAAALESLRATDRFISLPAYDRRLHDPVPDAIRIPPQTQVVLVEGNFLLSTDPPWDEVSRLLKPKLFLEEASAVARERIVQRHVRGGASIEQALEKCRSNDLLNMSIVRRAAFNADFVIQLDPCPQVRRLSRRQATDTTSRRPGTDKE